MRAFGLTPDDVLARTPAASLGRPLSAAASMLYGAVVMTLVSVSAYSIWAFKLIASEGVMYAAIAAVYLGLSGLALNRLVLGRGQAGRFGAVFAVAFLAYAIVWCAFWFGLRGKFHADLWGALLGLAVMVRMFQAAFGDRGPFLALLGVVFMTHTLGYTLGGDLHAVTKGVPGRLLYGVGHGLGFGAGLGYLLHRCQEPLRLRLVAK